MSDNNNNASLFLPSEDTAYPKNPLLARLLDLAGYPDPALAETDVGAYCFSLASGRVVFGMRIKELPDSYLVALPAILFGEDGQIVGRSLVAEPIVRLFKSSMLYACRAPEGQRYFYYKFLLGRRDVLPEILTPERVQAMLTETASLPEASRVALEAVAVAEDHSHDDDGGEPPAWNRMPYNKKTRH